MDIDQEIRSLLQKHDYVLSVHKLDDRTIKVSVPNNYSPEKKKMELYFSILNKNKGFKLICNFLKKPNIVILPPYAIKPGISASIECISAKFNYCTNYIFYYDIYDVAKSELPLQLTLTDDQSEKEKHLFELFNNIKTCDNHEILHNYKLAKEYNILEGYELICTLYSMSML